MTLYTIHASRLLHVCLVVLYLLAGAAIWLADLHWGLKGCLFGVVLFMAVMQIRKAHEFRLRSNEEGELQLWIDDEWRDVVVGPESVVLPAFVFLSVRVEGDPKPVRIPVLADSLPEEDFRRLRVWLKWRASVEQA